MKNKVKILATTLVVLIALFSIHSFSSKEVSFYPEKIKIALRSVGNELLLKNNDATSLVLPVKEISDQTFEVSFQKEIFINPEILAETIDAEFKKTGVPYDYITELINCKTNEVSYSYEVLGPFKDNEISCLGRNLPKSCYTIKVIILNENTSALYSAMGSTNTLYFIIIVLTLITGFTLFKKKSEENISDISSNEIILGKHIFYPDQQKLNIDKNEISLTAKESELLAIFAQHPNKIVKRELLIKQVWEDNGVIVGRSLDMFISKLRKKLVNDSEVKITNVHGVGYKLEINTSN
ncbi:Transcriptional regulatory protein, C terminal [Aquimarina amphilecti]|uniref:Transcriptional regulatory protein, C terminal n=1 Tax=Aquimarina amphilecti TaxID=1038014 RepID=A0A1H7HP53_AQUAM|nr:winged helix-turn-helix domain-containing protein [Aquimarina amphilecti]SEK51262.1 Transcriptional regulatory protein, C terminal [Aquimarina amphilecti]